MTRKHLWALCLAAVLAVPVAAGAEGTWVETNQVLLQGLDKITARTSTFEAPIGRTMRLGGLEIEAKTCRKRPPEEPPEAAAFLVIRQIEPDGIRKDIFAGWMFASSPALSALEHPVYDVWVIGCDPRKPAKSG